MIYQRYTYKTLTIYQQPIKKIGEYAKIKMDNSMAPVRRPQRRTGAIHSSILITTHNIPTIYGRYTDNIRSAAQDV